MSTTRKTRVPKEERIKLIKECRQSGLTDLDWCRANNIVPSTFYTWLRRCREDAVDIPKASYGHQEEPQVHQDVVPIEIVPDRQLSEAISASESCVSPLNPNLDNSHTIEISMSNLKIRICNGADPVLLSRTLRLLQEFSC